MGSKSTDTPLLEPIAVIGFSLQFPDTADSSENFWKMLIENRCVSQPFPKERISGTAIYHPDSSRHDTISLKGGHFINQDPGAFDAPFFGISAIEAASMDPQQRFLLEVTYRALENAGLPIQDLSGSNTSVFTGCFTDDYKDMYRKDLDDSAPYAATGITTTLNANRVSWFFNFCGTSINIDTACSSSLVAIDLACENLRSRKSNISIASGANLILSPDLFMILSDMNMLSPDSRCWSFDERGNGYGRGEGVASLILKRVSDAVRDGDTIRAVIRSSGSNHNGHTPGITQPSQELQERLIRECYLRAGLDLRDTLYCEAHGTGTPLGDPIEANAIGNVFRQERPADSPLFIGALKGNIGHLEGTSGIAGVIKAILVLEKAIIPPNANLENVNVKIDEEYLKIKFPREATPWPSIGLRRASVNSFGFGGSNGHVVLDDALHFLANYGLSANHNTVETIPTLHSDSIDSPRKQEANAAEVPGQLKDFVWPRLLVLSAMDQEGIARVANALESHYTTANLKDDRLGLDNLAFTLSNRRSILAWSSVSICRTLSDVCKISTTTTKPMRSKKTPRLGFVFTGQGAQWVGMGRELVSHPIFQYNIEQAQQYLNSLGCIWSITDILWNETEPSRLDQPLHSQTLCTVLQVALVDLLQSLGIYPFVVVGHSSGEIAAAYCAGAISRESAWRIAYLRGVYAAVTLENQSDNCGMMAVGLSPQATRYIIATLPPDLSDKLYIACCNSPRSVTVSGLRTQLDSLAKILDEQGIFHRVLKVEVAYHSPYMQSVADDYIEAIGTIQPRFRPMHYPAMISTVTGEKIERSTVCRASYWAENLLSPVQFDSAVSKLSLIKPRKKLNGTHAAMVQVDALIEIGPHPALAGPVRDVASSKTAIFPYFSPIRRQISAIESFFELAGQLHCTGYPVDIFALNHPGQSKWDFKCLSDLPEYPFDHRKIYMHESRVSKGLRLRQEPKLDLLGRMAADWNPLEGRWRHFLKLSELPWIEDHKVNGAVLYPAAGMLVMAIEAINQLDNKQNDASEFNLKNVKLHTALIIPASEKGVEIQFTLRRSANSITKDTSSWCAFRLYAYLEGGWIQICHGSVQVKKPTIFSEMHGIEDENSIQVRKTSQFSQLREMCKAKVDAAAWYKALRQSGFEFGPTFQSITNPSFSDSACTADIKVFEWQEAASENQRQDHVIHPSTLDGFLQLPLVADSRGGKRLTGVMVPSFIRHLRLSSSGANFPRENFVLAAADIHRDDNQGVEATLTGMVPGHDELFLEVEGIGYTRLAVAGSALDDTGKDTLAIWHSNWYPDLDLMDNGQIATLCKFESTKQEPVQFFDDLGFLLFAFLFQMLRNSSRANEQHKDPRTPRHIQKYLGWARQQVHKYEKNSYKRTGRTWATMALDQDVIASHSIAVENENAQGKVYVAVGKQLASLIDGKVDALQLLFQSSLLKDLYEELVSVPNGLKGLEKYLRWYSYNNPRSRFLEIGAGTAATTKEILKTITTTFDESKGPALYSEYVVTDISESFFENARDELRQYPNLSFKRLDIESSPDEQDFAPGSYDVVVAANVLHATTNLQSTLKHVYQLLRPGGKLILYEITNPEALRNNFSMGLLPGWWLSTESFRPNGPCISTSQWSEQLILAGFSGVDVEFRDYEHDNCYELSVLISTKPVAQVPETRGKQPSVKLVTDDARGQRFVAELQRAIDENSAFSSEAITISNLLSDSKDGSQSIYIFTDELVTPVLRNLDQEHFSKLQKCLNGCNTVIWLTKATSSGEKSPDFAMINGLSRVLRNECSTKFVTVGVEGNSSYPDFNWTDQVWRIAQKTFETKDGSYEEAYEQKDNILHVCRLQAGHSAVEAIMERSMATTSQQLTWGESPPLRLTIGSPGIIDTLHFVCDHSINNALHDDEVEIQVHAAGVNFKDCLIALGTVGGDTLGNECSGTVTRTGKTCTRIKVGDRVCMSTTEGFKSFARSKEQCVSIMPEGMTFTEGAALSTQFVTAWICITKLGRLQPTDTILIHAGAGGTGQAAIQLATIIGAEIYTTVGSEKKKQLLMKHYGIPESHILHSRDTTFASRIKQLTNGRGVDVVLNSLAGDSLLASWDCLAAYGRFVEIGKRDILADSPLPMFKFNAGASFCSFDGSTWMLDRPDEAQEGIAAILDLFTQGLIHPAAPLHVYNASDLPKAFRLLADGKSSGKAVVTFAPEDKIKVLLEKENTQTFASDKTYVIAGGLGGLGRQIARWMVSKGARWLLLLSRSGRNSASAKELIQELESLEARVATPQCDISNTLTLKQALLEVEQSMPPIAGCIQASMVLQDEEFAKMSFQQWEAAVKPKVDGSWNLHSLLPKDLDFFILLSSVSGIYGQHGQSNYAAANTYLDALALYRVALGQTGVSLDLGAMVDDGYLAENQDVKDKILSYGSMMPITRNDLDNLLDYYCSSSRALTQTECQSIVGINTRSNVTASGRDMPSWLRQPFFSAMDDGASSHSTQASSSDMMQYVRSQFIQAASVNQASQIVVEAIIEKLRRNIANVPDGIDSHTPIHSYGVDSLFAVELRTWLAKCFGADVPVFEIMGGATFAKLGAVVANKGWRPQAI